MDNRPQSPMYGAGQRSLFSQGPAFTIDTFQSKDFIVKDFIESLSDSAVPQSRRSGGQTSQAFDPRPLIRTFEAALNRINELSEELKEDENMKSASVKRAEAQHATNIQSLSRRLDSSLENFRKLDKSLTGYASGRDGGGSEAFKIGERLEDLDRQRMRAQDAKFLVQCWFEVSERGELFLLEDMRRQASSSRKIKCAQIARQLLKLSQRLDPASWAKSNGAKLNGLGGTNGTDTPTYKHNTREIIEKFSETLEKDLLKQFEHFQKRSRFEGMRECAEVLQDFGGGSSVIAMWVNSHSFFLDRAQMATDETIGDPETWELLADPDADAPGVEQSLQQLIDEVKIVVHEESSIIKKSFSYHETVIARFLQRIFQQSIQQKLEVVLDKAEAVSTLAFLRSLQSARTSVNLLVDDLKSHGLTEHPDPLSTSTANVLDQQFEDLFVPYVAGNSYVEREKRSLEELYSSLLFKFTVYHSKRRKAGPTTILASLAKSGSELLTSAREAYVERLDSTDLAPQQKARLLRVAGLKEGESARKQMETEFNEKDGVIDTANVKRMLRWLAEAVGRGLEIGGPTEIPKEVLALMELMLTHIGTQYAEVALDAANDAANAQENSKTEPDLSHLENFHGIVNVMNLMTSFVNIVMLPLAQTNSAIRREIEKKLGVFVGRLEEKINQLLQKTIDVTISWTTKLLANQKKTDFRPKDDDPNGGGAWLEQLQTPTCQSIFTFLTKVHNLSNNALSPSPNLTAFLTEIAVNVRGLLFDHFKKFTVSAMGGLMVTKDISKYNEMFRNWHLDESFEPSIEVMTEIGNIFVISPDALRERLRGKGGMLGGMWDKGDLRPYVMRREDNGSIGIQSVLRIL